MIESISIKNFKSIVDLKFELGRFNVFIGENGSGKSNILEGIAFGAAASVQKLDREFFSNRGIRYTDSKFMYSAFDDINEPIYITFYSENKPINFELKYNLDLKPAKWQDLVLEKYNNLFSKHMTESAKPTNFWEFDHLKESIKSSIESKLGKNSTDNNTHFKNFLIYSLEESALRKFDADNAIYPLGRNGEGLFAYLKEVSQKESGIDLLNEIKQNLYLLDWFDDLMIPGNQLSNEFSLQIRDKYINDTLHFFDQRSTNEGFLYLLFYLTLFISDETPAFFAIDNLESSFNPKLCREITKRLVHLAKKHNKQVIVTTHSPAILDGLDITNDDERLFVVRRNLDGHTKVNCVQLKGNNMNTPLSEAWTKGYIGGLPENF
jgi:Predicted ATPase